MNHFPEFWRFLPLVFILMGNYIKKGKWEGDQVIGLGLFWIGCLWIFCMIGAQAGYWEL